MEFDVFKANHGAAKREILCVEHAAPQRRLTGYITVPARPAEKPLSVSIRA
ncbi:hypothetical protein [Pyrobaculum arsenaticum]|uniref:hypothetical protein n=1 Tax=Pyrobaculum arsenaticum TaxID=121277 RepID=UPI000B004543|nr:hypothetical protein [Pyrobaculum arsenaticum]